MTLQYSVGSRQQVLAHGSETAGRHVVRCLVMTSTGTHYHVVERCEHASFDQIIIRQQGAGIATPSAYSHIPVQSQISINDGWITVRTDREQ